MSKIRHSVTEIYEADKRYKESQEILKAHKAADFDKQLETLLEEINNQIHNFILSVEAEGLKKQGKFVVEHLKPQPIKYHFDAGDFIEKLNAELEPQGFIATIGPVSDETIVVAIKN